MAKATCSIDGCERPVKGHGYCSKHYQRWRTYGDPTFVSRRDFAMAEFERLAALETDACVLWPGSSRSGYGLILIDGRHHRTHRVALGRRSPCPSPKMYACHQPGIGCQPLCMNYRHLRWAMPAENSADRIIDGTNSPVGGLTPQDIIAIRASSSTKAELARQFGVSWSAIDSIVNRQNWAGVP